MNPDIKAKLERRNDLADELRRIQSLDAAEVDARDVSALRQEKNAIDAELDAYAATRDSGESADYTANKRGAFTVTDRATAPGAPQAGDRFVRQDGRAAAVRSGESFGSHPVVAAARANDRIREEVAVAQFGGIAQMIRSLSTSGASAVVPTVWASEIIDLARNAAQVIKAGANVVPMDALTVNIGRLTADPTSAFRAEGSAITASDPTFDNVTLTARTLSCLVVGSMEWFADAPNADQLVSNAIGNSMGLAIDKAALYGGITTGAGTINLPTPPNPRGILAALNAVRPANVLGGAAANGTVLDKYNQLVDLDFLVENLNEQPTAVIASSRLWQAYAHLYDTTNQPMRVPPQLADLPFLTSNQVAAGMTQGTMTTAADMFLGDFRELLIGQRLDLTVQVLTERYADAGQIGIVATWRGDIQPARTSAFGVYRYLGGL